MMQLGSRGDGRTRGSMQISESLTLPMNLIKKLPIMRANCAPRGGAIYRTKARRDGGCFERRIFKKGSEREVREIDEMKNAFCAFLAGRGVK